MIRQLIETAMSDDNLAWGECFVVHIGPDDECNQMQPTSVRAFVREWAHLPGGDRIRKAIGSGKSIRRRWLGVVHETGVLVAPFDHKEFGFSDGTDPADWWKQCNES